MEFGLIDEPSNIPTDAELLSHISNKIGVTSIGGVFGRRATWSAWL